MDILCIETFSMRQKLRNCLLLEFGPILGKNPEMVKFFTQFQFLKTNLGHSQSAPFAESVSCIDTGRVQFGASLLVASPRTSLAGLQSTMTALPCTDYKTEELD